MTDDLDLDSLRAAFRAVARDRRASGSWTADDKTEIEALIRQAIAGRADDEGLLKCWHDWIHAEAAIAEQVGYQRERGMTLADICLESDLIAMQQKGGRQ